MSQPTPETGAQQPQEAAQQPAGGAPAPQATPTPQAPAPQQPAQSQQAESAEQRAARLEDELKQARAEAGRSRVNAKQAAADEARQDTLTKVLAALGIQPDGTKQVTLDDVQAESSRKDAELARAAAENTVLRTAAKAGADPDKLLNWAPFTRELQALDATAATYQQDVAGIIATHVQQAPFLATQAVGKSGAEIGGTDPGTITQARFDAMTGAERNQLYLTNPALYQQLSGN